MRSLLTGTDLAARLHIRARSVEKVGE
jgi:hypothetical protein